MELGLSRIRSTLISLNSPHAALPVVHVAGTNGKGSVVALVAGALSAGGARVGTFVSPFLREPRDAVVIDGAAASAEEWSGALREVAVASETAGVAPTTFESWTAAALLLFSRASLDVAVLEVGLGGLDDATNVVPPPLVAVIASISLDHMELLGRTRAAIATHKAGIFKRGGGAFVTVPGQTPEVLEVLRATAAGVSGVLDEPPARTREELPSLKLAGDFQARNAAAALRVVELLAGATDAPPPPDAPRALVAAAKAVLADGRALLSRSWASIRWRGRLEDVTLLDAPFLLDGGHNVEAMTALALELRVRAAAREPPPRVELVFACGRNRDACEHVRELLRGLFDAASCAARTVSHVHLIAVPFSTPEGMPWVAPTEPSVLAAAAENVVRECAYSNVSVASAPDVALAVAELVSNKDAAVLRAVCGSLYLVSDVYRTLIPEDWDLAAT